MMLQFPRPAEDGATKWQQWRSRFVVAIGKTLMRLGVPGAVRNAEISDDVSGHNIRVHIGPLFTRISVNGRDFYFDRFTGRFDGTGSGCSAPSNATGPPVSDLSP